jgi:phosphoglycerate dehydrogenase-like enzyme
VPTPRIAIGPKPDVQASDAVLAGGGEVVELGADADGLVWLSPVDTAGLRSLLDGTPGIRWIQLPFAGVEHFAGAGLFGDGRTWTCAKGAYAEPVAEHALTLALAGLRHLPERIAARSWGVPMGRSLYDSEVTILGGGGITERLLEQLAPFRVRATVVRRRADPVPGAARTVATEDLHSVLPGALVVFLALALTPETTCIIGAPELELMDEQAWLVNVARGRHVATDDLVAALRARRIAGAALDVTDPEPLPDGHPLWDLPNAVITPHTADWPEIVMQLLARRIATNVRRFGAGESLEGLVDGAAGY